MRVAILSFHSHSDRSFLDDRELAILSGELRDDGVANDRVEVVFDEGAGETAGESNQAVLERLSTCLAEYDVIAFQRVHSVERLGLLRERLPGKPFVRLEGEHPLDETHSDYVCKHPLTETLARLAHHLTQPDEELGEPSPRPPEHRAKRRAFQPNLFPIQINPAALPASRTFTVLGNKGCPYQTDARDNPLYAGVEIPEGYGRGCAFCTSGNVYERGADTVERVLGELEFLHRSGAERRDIVLKDQNPFAYLTELIERCAERKLQPFTLLLETRADWFLKAETRFARALAVAEQANLSIAPYLVGIENFSQAELDRFNKGITAEENERFLRCLRDWKRRYGAALNLDHASFGFVLFTPWTTLDDLETNFHAIKRTRFCELRGRILLSRARLYPDNALYYLAARDGLLQAEFASPAEDNSRRYGYLPARPWRFAQAEVAHFSQLATTLCEATGGRDELRLFGTLLDAFHARPWHEVEASAILRELSREPTKTSTSAPAKRMHEQQLFLIQDDALEDRILARRPPAADKPFAELEAEIARAPDVYRWVLTGGRPTLHCDFYRVLELVTATTAERIALEIDGGALAEPGVLERLVEAGVNELFVHLPALGERAHREMLGDDPVRECLEGVARACHGGLATYVVLTLARPNVREVPRVVEWLVSLPQRPKAILLALPTPSRLTVADRARVLPPLAAAELASKVFDRCRRMSVEFGFRSKRGVAACTARGVLDRHGTVFHDRHMFFRNGNDERLQRVRVCTTCSLQHTCKGVEPALVKLFGEAQLAPIPLEVSMDWKLQEINKLGVREYRNVSPFRVSGRGETRGLLRINGHCNMSCAFCFVDRTAPDFAADGLIDEIDRMLTAGTQHVVISGGEPTLHPDLPRLIRHARAGGAHTVEIQTNGVRCAKLDYASSLVDAGLTKITISLHSADPERSDKITRLPGAFGKTIQAMHNFRKLGVLTQVAHVITKSNYQELPGMMRFLGEQFPPQEAELSVCVAIAQGISDLVYGWVVPRFSEIRPYVRQALDYCLEEHIGFGGMIGQGGYPPCMLDGELKYYQDAYDHLYVSDDWADQFHKAERCQRCVFDPHCLGVRKSYVETYGDEEFVPFSADPRLLPSTAPIARASTGKLVPLRVPRRSPERDT